MKQPRPRGFTLIEIMIASVVFLLVVGGVFSAMGTAAHQFQHQRKVTVGLHLAELTMEELLLHFQTSQALKAGLHARYFTADGTVSPAPIPGGYTVTWDVTPGEPLPKLRRIDVVSTWTEAGIPRSISLFTFRP